MSWNDSGVDRMRRFRAYQELEAKFYALKDENRRMAVTIKALAEELSARDVETDTATAAQSPQEASGGPASASTHKDQPPGPGLAKTAYGGRKRSGTMPVADILRALTPEPKSRTGG